MRFRVSLWACLIAILFAGCTRERRIRIGQDIRMDPFTLRVTSVEGYSRAHQGIPWEVEIRLDCSGGNRFERMDFAEALSRKGGVRFATAEGWHDRAWLLRRGDDMREFFIHVNPPEKSSGMTLALRDPRQSAAGRDRILVDLGK